MCMPTSLETIGLSLGITSYFFVLLLVLSGEEVSTLVQSVLNFNPLPPPS